ncbi:hypothetical protein M2138_001303 [Dysgonomonadaceae bacterium PH5-43]|nr:hypothetical protein [Dysgonomonadaceae bacterium PH5-43]
MRYIYILLLPIVFVLASILYSCDDGFENYSTNPNKRLTFSTDTIAFDTIISTINTPFKSFKVYNKNSENLLISSVYLEGGSNSVFKINVNGKAGQDISNIEIKKNDSIYVFIDAKPIENNTNEPKHISDNIVFTTNGVNQKVIIEASAQDVYVCNGMIINTDSTLLNNKPYLIYDSLVVDKNVTLNITEGTVFYMHGGSKIKIDGTLKAKGSLEKPIVIRADRFDSMVNIPYDLIPGQWGGITFGEDSYNNELEHTHIRNGYYGLNFKESETSSIKASLNNVVLTNFKGYLINSVNCNINAENCEFTNSQKTLLNLIGGNYNFTHCTIANHYFSSNEYGWGTSDNQTVFLSNKHITEIDSKTDSVFYPLEANFFNSLVWGTKDKTSSRITIYESDKANLSYFFENCLIPNGENDNPDSPEASVVNCVIGENPEFNALLIDKDNKVTFKYDFSLTEKSPARSKANKAIANTLPLDIKGNSRLTDENPDIGANEYIETANTEP